MGYDVKKIYHQHSYHMSYTLDQYFGLKNFLNKNNLRDGRHIFDTFNNILSGYTRFIVDFNSSIVGILIAIRILYDNPPIMLP